MAEKYRSATPARVQTFRRRLRGQEHLKELRAWFWWLMILMLQIRRLPK
jgi:hypothetical protein